MNESSVEDRISRLLDAGSFREILSGVENLGFETRRAGDGVLAGFGRIEGRNVAVYGHDPSFQGGSIGEVGARKIARLYRAALKYGVPVIALSDSSGARIHEGPSSLIAVGELFQAVAEASGKIPQITVVLGGCVGGAAFTAALGDLVVGCSGKGYIFINGPRSVKQATGEEVTAIELGGVDILARSSGMVDLLAADEEEAIRMVKSLLAYLPSNRWEPPPIHRNTSTNRHGRLEIGSDVKSLVKGVFDDGSVLELQPLYAPNIFTGLARLDGTPVGVVANQRSVGMGFIDIKASNKIERLIRLSDNFNLPIVTFVDTPGFAPGRIEEHNGLVREGSKIFKSFITASVPKISVIMGRTYGGAYIAMCSRGLGADYVIGLTDAEVAVLPPETAAEFIYRRQLESLSAEERERALHGYVDEIRRRSSGPALLSVGVVDKIIEPEELRTTLIDVVKSLHHRYVRTRLDSAQMP